MDTGAVFRGETTKERKRDRFLKAMEYIDSVRDEELIDRCMMSVSYRDALYKSNTTSHRAAGGSTAMYNDTCRTEGTMSKLDLSKKLEKGDLLVGECRCDPDKKGVVEVVGYSSRGNAELKFPNGHRLYTSSPKKVVWGNTVGAAIGFIEDSNCYTAETHANYHNWKHIPKRDFTWEVGDILYGECACTPSKFVVFEYCGDSDYKVIACWDKTRIGCEQSCSYGRIHAVASHGCNTLNEYVKSVFSPEFVDYNYTKHTKEEW